MTANFDCSTTLLRRSTRISFH